MEHQQKAAPQPHVPDRVARSHLPDRLWFVLILIGVSYPVVRIVLPGTARVALLLPLLLLLLWFGWRPGQPRRLLCSPLGLPLLAVAAALAGSGLFGIADPSTVIAVLFHWGAVAVLLFLSIELLAAGRSPAMFLYAALLTSSLVLLLGLGVLLQWWAGWLLVWQPGQPLVPVDFRRSLGNLHPNHAAMLINIGLPLAIAALWRAQTRAARWLWGGWLLAAVVVLFATSSRGGWLGAAAASATLLLPLMWSALRARQWRRLRNTVLLAGGYAALFVALFVANIYTLAAQRAVASQQTSPEHVSTAQVVQNLTTSTGRVVFWQYALQFFAEQPLTGVGPGGYSVRYAAEETHSRAFLPADPHNIYLGILTEGGLLGALAVVLLALAALRVWWRGWQRAAPLREAQSGPGLHGRLLLLASGAAGMSLLVHGLVEVPPTAITGIVLIVLVAGLAAGGAWNLAPTRRGWQWAGLQVQPLHLVLLLAALLAWGSSTLVVLQRGERETLRNAAAAAVERGDYDEALAIYADLLNRWPWYGVAYSERATTLAYLAYNDPSMLPAALAAQEQAMQHYPQNQAGPVNRGVLLLELERVPAAQAELAAFAERDRTGWVLPLVLLARVHEQSGAPSDAREAWQRALNNEPATAESAACLASPICASLTPPPSAYSALLQAEALRDQPGPPTADDLQRIWELGDAWDSVDIWAVGAAAAAQANEPRWRERFLTAAQGQAGAFAREPTSRLAVVLLHDALERKDDTHVRALTEAWIGGVDMLVVPQASRLLITTTERELARTLVEAASFLDDPALLEQARRYLQRVEAALRLNVR